MFMGLQTWKGTINSLSDIQIRTKWNVISKVGAFLNVGAVIAACRSSLIKNKLKHKSTYLEQAEAYKKWCPFQVLVIFLKSLHLDSIDTIIVHFKVKNDVRVV